MNNCDFLLKKCNDFFESTEKDIEIKTAQMRPSAIPRRRRMQNAEPPKTSPGIKNPKITYRRSLKDTKAPTIHPPHPTQYKYVIEKWEGKTKPPKQVVGPDGKVKIYIDRNNKIIIDAFPDELREASLTPDIKIIHKNIKSSINSHLSADLKIKYHFGNLSDKIQSIKGLAKLNSGKIGAITSGGIVSLMILGNIYSLLTKAQPQASSEFGNKLKEGSVEI